MLVPSTETTWAAQTRGSSGERGPTGGQERIELGDGLGLNEEIGERGMGRVVARRRQHDLGVRSHLDLARLAAEIRQGHAPDLGVVLRRDQHLEPRQQMVVAPLDLGAVLQEGHFVPVGLDSRGLEAGRPDGTASRVTQEDERPQASRVVSSRQRVTARPPQWL